MPWCRPCNREYAKSRRTFDTERTAKLRQKFGITPEQYRVMLDRQGGVCAVCKRPETRRGNHGQVKHLAVDHDHRTGRIRGLLCHDCNVAIGYLADDPERMRDAMAYLDNTDSASVPALVPNNAP